MRESTEQCFSVNLLRLGIATNVGPFGQAAQAVYPLETSVEVRPKYAQSLCKEAL
jgi:hypothetical protein